MNKQIAKNIFKNFSLYAKKEKISFFLVGSLGYKNVFKNENKMELCDDIDCIFIYDDINSLKNFKYLSSELFNKAQNLILNKQIDMFSNKFYIKGIQISADYISRKYLQELLEEDIEGINKFRKKLTDSKEKNENTYCNIFGETLTYIKICEELNKYRIYKLPIHLFVNNKFYPGVLLNKFLYNPLCLVDNNSESLVKEILKKIELYCKKEGDNASVYNTFYKKEVLSEEEKIDLGWKR